MYIFSTNRDSAYLIMTNCRHSKHRLIAINIEHEPRRYYIIM